VIAGPALPGATVLADGNSSFGAGFIAFVVVVALCVASYFLFRSMNRHLKGLPTKFPKPPADDAEPTVATAPAADPPKRPDA
jgi:hypothetical protein